MLQVMLLLQSRMRKRQIVTHHERHDVLMAADKPIEFDDRFGADGPIDADEDVHDLALAVPVRERHIP